MKKVVLFLIASFLVCTLYAKNISFSIAPIFTDDTKIEYRLKDSDKWQAVTSPKIFVNPEKNSKINLKLDDKIIDVYLIKTDNDTFNVRWKFDLKNYNNQPMRYRINNSDVAKLIKRGSLKVDTENIPTNELTLFTLETLVAKRKWVESEIVGVIPYRENKNRFSLRTIYTPYVLSIFDFYNGHNIKDAKFLTMTEFGFGGDIELCYNFGPVKPYVILGYSYGLKPDVVIPDSHAISHVNLGLGFDLRVFAKNNFSTSIGIYGGLLTHFNANYYNYSSHVGAKVHIDWECTDTVTLGFQTGLKAAYLPDKEPLFKSMTYIISPLSFVIEMRF